MRIIRGPRRWNIRAGQDSCIFSQSKTLVWLSERTLNLHSGYPGLAALARVPSNQGRHSRSADSARPAVHVTAPYLILSNKNSSNQALIVRARDYPSLLLLHRHNNNDGECLTRSFLQNQPTSQTLNPKPRLVESNHPDVLGPNNANLPTIFGIFSTILETEMCNTAISKRIQTILMQVTHMRWFQRLV